MIFYALSLLSAYSEDEQIICALKRILYKQLAQFCGFF